MPQNVLRERYAAAFDVCTNLALRGRVVEKAWCNPQLSSMEQQRLHEFSSREVCLTRKCAEQLYDHHVETVT